MILVFSIKGRREQKSVKIKDKSFLDIKGASRYGLRYLEGCFFLKKNYIFTKHY